MSTKKYRPVADVNRAVRMMTSPERWMYYPFLPVVRWLDDGSDNEVGILADTVGAVGVHGYSATIFLTNLFALPRTWHEFFALPKLVFDTPEEIVAAHWGVD